VLGLAFRHSPEPRVPSPFDQSAAISSGLARAGVQAFCATAARCAPREMERLGDFAQVCYE